MSGYPILVSGSIAYDYIMQYSGHFADHILPEQLDQLNVCYVVDQLHRYHGGTAGNICYNLQLLGQQACILGAVGYDYDRSHIQAWSHIDSSLIAQNDFLTTASFFGTSDRQANQLMFFSPGAMSDSAQIHAPQDDQIQYVIIAPDDPHTMMLRLQQYQDHSAQVIRDPGQQITNLSAQQLQDACHQADMMILNDYEYELMQTKTGYDTHQLQSLLQHIIVTQGEQGSTRYHGGQAYHVPAVVYHASVYPTGAGDAYRAGLLHGLVHRPQDWTYAMQIASVMGRYAIQHHGPQEHTCSYEDMMQKLQDTYGV